MKGVIPLPMERISDDVQRRQFFVGHFDASRIRVGVLDGSDDQSFLGGSMGNQFNDCFQRGQRLGAPVDGDVGKESMFDLVPRGTVPGGKWQTVMVSPVSVANRCISRFHKRLRAALEPPPSAVMSNLVCSGYKRLPCWFHQRRILSTANSAVSWSMPTFTQPWFCIRS